MNNRINATTVMKRRGVPGTRHLPPGLPVEAASVPPAQHGTAVADAAGRRLADGPGIEQVSAAVYRGGAGCLSIATHAKGQAHATGPSLPVDLLPHGGQGQAA